MPHCRFITFTDAEFQTRQSVGHATPVVNRSHWGRVGLSTASNLRELPVHPVKAYFMRCIE